MLNEGLEELEDCDGGGDYYGVFENSGIKEITLPSTLKRVGKCTFKGCGNLRTIYVAKGCKADLFQLNILSFAEIVYL